MAFPHYLRETPLLNRYLVVFGALFVLSQALIIWLLGDVGLQLLALQTTFTKAGFTSIVSAWGPEEFEKLKVHYRFDMLHPIWHALFLASLLAKLFNATNIPEQYNVFIWTPVIAGLCDFAENAIHAPFVYNVYSMLQPYIFLGAFFATVKWFLAVGTTIACLVLCGRCCFEKPSQKRRT